MKVLEGFGYLVANYSTVSEVVELSTEDGFPSLTCPDWHLICKTRDLVFNVKPLIARL
jgi:hypothetical protein